MPVEVSTEQATLDIGLGVLCGGKGTAPGCAHCVGAQRYQAVPKSTVHAVSDVGALVEWLQEHIVFGQNSADNLAVLHNQNHVVHAFGLSAWYSIWTAGYLT